MNTDTDAVVVADIETDSIELVVKEINVTSEKTDTSDAVQNISNISNISNIPKFIFIIP